MSTLAKRSSSTDSLRRPDSKASRIVVLARAGMRPGAIAAKLETDASYVRATICRARHADESIAYYRRPRAGLNNAAKLVTPAVCDRIADEAALRGMAPGELVAEILTIIAEDGLFDAVLERADDCN
jgi:hypothetical protein